MFIQNNQSGILLSNHIHYIIEITIGWFPRIQIFDSATAAISVRRGAAQKHGMAINV